MACCFLNNSRRPWLLLHAWSSAGRVRSRIHSLHMGRASGAHLQGARLLPSSTIHDCGLLDRLSRDTVTHSCELLLWLSTSERSIQMSLLPIYGQRWNIGIVQGWGHLTTLKRHALARSSIIQNTLCFALLLFHVWRLSIERWSLSRWMTCLYVHFLLTFCYKSSIIPFINK